MKRATFRSNICVVLFVFLLLGICTIGFAQVETLKIEITDVVSLSDAIKIRHLLSPWVDAGDINFRKPVDKNGKERLFSTVVELKPRRGVSKYSETHTFDIYDIMRQLKDSRYRGRHGLSQVRLLKTEATVRGNIFAYPGHRRSDIHDIPSYARWRPQTSEIHHALKIGDGQNMVFKATPEFDELRRDAVKENKEVEIEGKIVGFDGVYPIMKIESYRFGYRVNQQKAPANKPMEGNNPEEQQKPKYDYIDGDR